jgi:hypothetical protein
LLRDPERNEGELDLAGLEQLDVLGWSFGRPCKNRNIELASQQLCETFTVFVVGTAGRSGQCASPDRAACGRAKTAARTTTMRKKVMLMIPSVFAIAAADQLKTSPVWAGRRL